jgi:hypothetical protein
LTRSTGGIRGSPGRSIETTFVDLVKEERKEEKENDSRRVLSWEKAFNVVDISDMPHFARRMATIISQPVNKI